ncbi:interaptin [Hylaeus volcanicus]|uniref:interaptin n=1 Tax=Hylaeus volcanicus TaxID=313075 RepID=UPI0023B82B97|nr:interaptin [Hylaeus volcanicus]
MQTEVPTLPIVHLNDQTNLNRKQNSNLRRSTVQTKASTQHKNIACISSNKKNLHPLLGQLYQSSIRQKPLSEHSKLNKNSIKQRVLSAKMLRIKELQNQLADAHYQLNELANENRLLKSLQKRQDSALKRYEGTNAELPRIINSHHEELRVLQIKYKKLKVLHKETCNLLKEKENELQQLQSQNKHLLQLSKDRNLGEREKLQLQVSDLNYRIQQQQDTIQTLHRKLALESKCLKQQLYTEVSKRKETQKHLDETIEKLKSLEHLLDNKERRLYYSGQLLHPNKNRQFGTQSLTNLRDISSSNPLKLSDQSRRWQRDVEESSLPVLCTSESNDKSTRTDERINLNQTTNSLKTETMTNLEQIRKYRLQKSAHRKVPLNDSEEKSKEVGFKLDKNSKISMHSDSSEGLEKQVETDGNQYEISADSFRKIYENRNYSFHDLLKKKVVYSSEDGESEDESFQNDHTSIANNSRKLCRRLINNADDTTDSKELTFSNSTFRDKLEVLEPERKNSYEDDSETESEIRQESIKHYLSLNHQNDALKLISSICDDQTRYSSDEELEQSTPSRGLNESYTAYQNLIKGTQVTTKNVNNENLYNLRYDEDHTHTQQSNVTHLINNVNKSSEDLHKYMLEQSESNKQEDNAANTSTNELQNKSFLQTSSTEEYNQLETSFKASDTIQLTNINTESLLDAHEVLNNLQSKPSRKNSLKTSSYLDKGQVTNVTYKNETETVYDNRFAGNHNVETKNKLNKQEVNKDLKSADVLLNNSESLKTDSIYVVPSNADVNSTNETSARTKPINYNKEQLLATMKAIDDNENIEFLNQDYEKHNATSRKQITENLFHGLPTHTKKKQDIIKDIFETDGFKKEPASSYNKLH